MLVEASEHDSGELWAEALERGRIVRFARPPFELPGPRELRAWILAAGVPEADRYLLGLDPHAPDTHSPLASALMRVGMAPTLIGTRGARPALRISGRRRLSRLVENVGEPPEVAEALPFWPRV